MSVGIAIVGRDVTVTVGGAALLGTLSKNISFNNEVLDTTDDAASGWTELAATGGLRSLEIGLSGSLKNLELAGLYFGASQAVEVVWTFPDGVSTNTSITFDAVLSALSFSGDSNTGQTWDATLQSSGAPTYVAAT